MIDKMQNTTYNDLEWKNHQDFFKNLYDNIPKVQAVGEKCLEEIEYINKYYSMLNIFKIPLKPYIKPENYKKISQDLDSVQKFLFSKTYIIAVRHKEQLSMDKKYELSEKQWNAYNILNRCFETIVGDLSEMDILPRVSKKPWINPANAVKGVYQ